MQLIVSLTEESEVAGLIPSSAHTLLETDYEIFSTVIPHTPHPLPLIQEGQLTVTGKSMCAKEV